MVEPGVRLLLFCAALIGLAGSAAAQVRPAPDPRSADAAVIAVPTLATARQVDTDAGNTWLLANQIAELVTADLKTTGRFIVADVKKIRIPSFPEVTAPSYAQWRGAGAKLLLSGFVNARDDGRLTIGCYLYDVQSGRELARQGFALAPSEWRRAAHRCADVTYMHFTGSPPLFDSRIAYVAQSGSGDARTKRLAIMDFDGANHGYLTDGGTLVLGPSWSRSGRVAYTSFAGGRPHVRVIDIAANSDRPLPPVGEQSFAPAFAPEGDVLALAASANGNTDIYLVNLSGGVSRRLTVSPAIDTSPSFSPDGRRIVFSSDRSGTLQIYVMDSDGANQRRISFGPGEYGAPVWSPDGERIAFTNLQGVVKRIGILALDGSGERILAAGPNDEEPAWSPDGGHVLFERLDSASGRTVLATVPVQGGDVRTVSTPQGASDPSWAGGSQ